MSRTITYTLRGKTMTYKVDEPTPTVDPVVARAVAEYAATEACRKYEETAVLYDASPSDLSLQRAMQNAYTLSIQACDRARKLRQQ